MTDETCPEILHSAAVALNDHLKTARVVRAGLSGNGYYNDDKADERALADRMVLRLERALSVLIVDELPTVRIVEDPPPMTIAQLKRRRKR